MPRFTQPKGRHENSADASPRFAPTPARRPSHRRADAARAHGRLDLRGRGGRDREGAEVRVDERRRRSDPRREPSAGCAHDRAGGSKDGSTDSGRRRFRRPDEPEGTFGTRCARGAGLARCARLRRGDGHLPLRRRPLRFESRGLAIRAADADRRRRDSPASLAQRTPGRLRARQRSLGARSRHEDGDPPDLGRRRHDPERHALLALLGRDLRPRRHRLLVGAGLVRDRVPAHRRVGRGRRRSSPTSRPPFRGSSSSGIPRTGGANPTVRLGIADVSGKAIEWMEPSEVPYEYVLGVDWLPDSRAVAVQTTNRAQTRLDVWRFDRAGAKATRVVSDTDPALVYQKELQFADGGKTWIVSFEIDGHTHLFRYGADGVRRNAITQGPWSVRGGRSYGAPQGSAFVDEANGVVYFTAIEKSSLESHLYRIRLDGTGMARITKEDGTHKVAFSPDRRFYVDAYSNRNAPPSAALYDASGRRAGDARGKPDGPPRSLRPGEARAPHDPRRRRVRAPREPAEAAGLRRVEEIPGPDSRLRRARLADRAGPLGPGEPLRPAPRLARLCRGGVRSAQRDRPEQEARGPRRCGR